MNEEGDKTREFVKSSPALKHAPLTDNIIAAFYEAYNKLGFGFLESVYRNALAIALRKRGLLVKFKRLILTNDQKKIRVHPCESVVGQ
jgi:GxxExxY protein